MGETKMAERSEPGASSSHAHVLTPELIGLLEGSRRASDQRIGWGYQSWNKRIGCDQRISEVLVALEDAWVADPRGLSRDAVSKAGGDDPVQLFVAVMVWGFGSLPYGPARTEKMLAETSFEKSVTQIMENARQSPEDGFRSLFVDGRPIIPGLSIAMGTKFLYFCSPPIAQTPTPVVYDIVVYNALKLLAPDLAAPSPRGYVTAAKYAEVCKWMADVAQQADGALKVDDVEYALFQYSTWVRRKNWRDFRGL
jgi:hypothetical protein